MFTFTSTNRRRTSTAFVAGLAVAISGAVAFQAFTAGAFDDQEATFVPIQPCRLFDTRPAQRIGPNTSLGPNTAQGFQVTGTNGECTIPLTATAVSINITGAVATEQTNIRVYPADKPIPGTAVLNLLPGELPESNKIDVGLSAGGAIGIYNRFGGVDLIGDVLGYYRHDGLENIEKRVTTLETRVAAIEQRLASP